MLARLAFACALTVSSAFTVLPYAPITRVAARTTAGGVFMVSDAVAAKIAAAKKKAAEKAAAAAAAAPAAEAGAAEEEETEEQKAAREEAEKKAAEEKKKAEEAEKKRKAAEAKAKKDAEDKAAAIKVFADPTLVLLETAMMNPPPATITERSDYLLAEGIPAAAIKAAMAELGLQEVTYQRDAWGRIVAPNAVKFSPNVSPPPSDAFGQVRARETASASKGGDGQRDAWGRLIASNSVEFSPNAAPPPSDSFGQLRERD